MNSIGILGSGQLARFLTLEAHRLGFSCGAFGPSLQDPAALVQNNFTKGDISDVTALTAFFKNHQVITFESEFFDPKLLARAEAASDVRCAPNLRALATVQDRLPQKQELEKFTLPTLSFLCPETEQDLRDFFRRHKKGLVLKARRFGYDGYGTFILRSSPDLNGFLQNLRPKKLTDFIAEPFTSFRRELAVIAYRSANGDVGFFPLVEWKAKDAKCWWVKGPVKNARFERLKPKLARFLKGLDYVGVMAFEMFETASALYINEVAPRVHNSGHYSLNAMPLNQFAMHLLCLHGAAVPKAVEASVRGFAMVNLIGSGPHAPVLEYSEGSWLHWYEKKENRAGRKMGHINAIGRSPDDALRIALRSAKRCRL